MGDSNDRKSSRDKNDSKPVLSRKSSREHRKSFKPRRSSHERRRRSSHERSRRGSDERHYHRQRRDTFIGMPPQPMMMQRSITPLSWRPVGQKRKPCCSAGAFIFVCVMILLILGSIGGYLWWKDQQKEGTRSKQSVSDQAKAHNTKDGSDSTAAEREASTEHGPVQDNGPSQEVPAPKFQKLPKFTNNMWVKVKETETHKGGIGQISLLKENSDAHKKHYWYTYKVQLYRGKLLEDCPEADLEKPLESEIPQ